MPVARGPLSVLLGAVVLPLSLAAPGSATAATAATAETITEGTFVGRQPFLYDATFAIQGQVMAAGKPVPDTPDGVVLLLVKRVGDDAFTQIAEAADEGAWSFTPRAGRNATYRVEYTGGTVDGTTYGGSSASGSVTVRRNLHDGMVEQDGAFYLRGNVDPGWAGKPVVVQRRTCADCAWQDWGSDVTGNTGAWRLRVRSKPEPGTWSYRAYVVKTDQYARSFGNRVWSLTTS